jgi:galactose mutarotase-like enzyme
MLRRGEDGLPKELLPGVRSARSTPIEEEPGVGDGPYDDAFWVPSGRARIQWPGRLAIDVATEGSWFVVFDERPEAICLEPQSGPPDGLVDHPWFSVERLSAGVPRTWRTTWTMCDLREDQG